MEGQFMLTQTVIAKEVMKEANDGVGSFSCVTSFINEVVHLAGNSLTSNTKDHTLLGIDGAWLKELCR